MLSLLHIFGLRSANMNPFQLAYTYETSLPTMNLHLAIKVSVYILQLALQGLRSDMSFFYPLVNGLTTD